MVDTCVGHFSPSTSYSHRDKVRKSLRCTQSPRGPLPFDKPRKRVFLLGRDSTPTWVDIAGTCGHVSIMHGSSHQRNYWRKFLDFFKSNLSEWVSHWENIISVKKVLKYRQWIIKASKFKSIFYDKNTSTFLVSWRRWVWSEMCKVLNEYMAKYCLWIVALSF